MELNSNKLQNNPLLSFCLVAYNQESFIREAVQGALDQTYSPLQIVLSDDCSSDRTFDIMQEMTANYKGPHDIMLNRNANNLGLVGNINRTIKLCHGEWIIKADGDDISLKNRVEIISKIIKNKNIFGIGTASQIIDRKNNIKGVQYVTNTIFGSNSAWHRKCFEYFGDLPVNLGCEDNVLYFRSLLLGGVAFSNEITVRYRMYDSISNKSYSDLKGYYVHKLKMNNLILSTLDVRINELRKFDMDLPRKYKVQKILENKKTNISDNNIFISYFIDLTEKTLLNRLSTLFGKRGSIRISLKKKIKLLFLTNSFFAKLYTWIAPGWLTIGYPHDNINSSNEIIIKTLDDYIEESDVLTHW